MSLVLQSNKTKLLLRSLFSVHRPSRPRNYYLELFLFFLMDFSLSLSIIIYVLINIWIKLSIPIYINVFVQLQLYPSTADPKACVGLIFTTALCRLWLE